MVLLHTNDLTVRRLQPADADLLATWLSAPTILEFYEGRDRPFDLQRIRETFFDRHDDVLRAIVEYNHKPIGYIQFYIVSPTEHVRLEKWKFETVYGMDQFIGDPTYWNRGIGTKLVTAMTTYLIEEKQADRIILDPHVTNVRAIRCYEKSGFSKVKRILQHEYHEGAYRESWLMTFESVH